MQHNHIYPWLNTLLWYLCCIGFGTKPLYQWMLDINKPHDLNDSLWQTITYFCHEKDVYIFARFWHGPGNACLIISINHPNCILGNHYLDYVTSPGIFAHTFCIISMKYCGVHNCFISFFLIFIHFHVCFKHGKIWCMHINISLIIYFHAIFHCTEHLRLKTNTPMTLTISILGNLLFENNISQYITK